MDGPQKCYAQEKRLDTRDCMLCYLFIGNTQKRQSYEDRKLISGGLGAGTGSNRKCAWGIISRGWNVLKLIYGDGYISWLKKQVYVSNWALGWGGGLPEMHALEEFTVKGPEGLQVLWSGFSLCPRLSQYLYLYWNLYPFPGAATTNDHKLGGLKRQKSMVLRSWRPEVQNKGVGGAPLHLGSLEESPSSPLPCLALLAFLGLWSHHADLCLRFTLLPLLCLYVS